MAPPTLYLIGGPTASGKSALALEIARRENGVIINADAMQVYKGLPILTSQPSPDEKKEIPHKLYEVVDPAERSSVAGWLLKAQEAIHNALRDKRTPIVVGGTGLYFKALMEGLAEIPDIPDNVRASTQELYEKLGPDEFRSELAKADPDSASRLKPNDRQRLIRAYEVVRYTGKPLGHWQTAKTHHSAPAPLDPEKYDLRPILLLPERNKLYATCNKRFLAMMERGAMDEVKALTARQLDPGLPAMKIIGVPELSALFKGDMSREEAQLKAQQATRNYAKRQITWFKNQWKGLEGLRVY